MVHNPASVSLCLCVTAALLLAQGADAQILMGSDSGDVHLNTIDRAVFAAGEKRDDLRCRVDTNKAVLGFDLRYHASYEIVVPLKQLSGDGNELTIVLEVTNRAHPDAPVHLMQKVRVPPIEDDANGDAYLQGGFDLGEGEYDIGLVMRDRAERVCAHFWDTTAKLSGREQDINLVLAPGQIVGSEVEQFRKEPPVVRQPSEGGQLLNVKILVNFAPQNDRAATLQPFDTSALVSILRTISREPRIGTFSVVAFNLQEQRILSRQDHVERIDFPALGKSLDSLNLGTVNLTTLQEKHGDTEFLTKLMMDEVSKGDADAIIFAGPKAILDQNVPGDELEEIGNVDFPIYYLNYNLFPHRTPWRDTIARAVRQLDGREFSISEPPDLWYAVQEIVNQIDREKKKQKVTQNDLQ